MVNYDYINNDNIIFEKVWDDSDGFFCVGNFFQINVTAYNSFVKVNNFNFYMSSGDAKELSNLINKYIHDIKTSVYEYKNGAVYNDEIMSLEIKQVDVHGHVIINLKIENLVNGNKNYSELFIETELGLLESFGKKLLELVKGGIGYKISLNKELE